MSWDMLIITENLTIGQLTFILRVSIQLLLYGGLFLLTLIILGQAPRIATVETHDILNRIVSNSTITMSTLKWITNRVVRGHRDPGPSSSLILAIFLSFSYGLFASISDIGFIGFSSCSVAGGNFQDFPGSVRSMNDARAVIAGNMMNGTDPSAVNSYRCDSAHDVVVAPLSNITERICTLWHNSTYGDPTDFRRLNTTDSDILMPKNLARDIPYKDGFDTNLYFRGATGQLVSEAVLSGGIAVMPHDIGVKMIVGVPQLTVSQKVFIPKTMALEVEMGCMRLGLFSQQDTGHDLGFGVDFFTPDSMYNSTVRGYMGPDYLEKPLTKAANAMRDFMLPRYNMSDLDRSGFMRGSNDSHSAGKFTWDKEVHDWIPGSPSIHSSDIYSSAVYILRNCSEDIHQSLNVTYPAASLRRTGKACVIYSLSGSFFAAQTTIQAHSEMICASATQLNMVSALIEVGGDGKITANLTRLPSDLNKVEANFFDHFVNKHGVRVWEDYDPIQRFTLSDNPNGQGQHFIYQQDSFTGATGPALNSGPGSMGEVLSNVGSSMLGLGLFNSPLLGVVDPQFFTSNTFRTREVTKWGGSLGASYILGSMGYNAWAAIDTEPVTVTITGGKSATCYNYRYAIAFLPLVFAALLILTWSAILLFSSQIRGAGKCEKVYGGLAPMMVAPEPGRPPPRGVLLWERDPELHLSLVMEDKPIVGDARETLVGYMKRPNTLGEMDDK